MRTLKELIVELAKRVSKGFDFNGFHCHSNGMTLSEDSLSRLDQKSAWLYKQSMSKDRIGAYLGRCFGWAGAIGCCIVIIGCEVIFPDVSILGDTVKTYEECGFKCMKFEKSCDIDECFDFINETELPNTEYVWIMVCNTVFGGLCVNQSWRNDAEKAVKKYYPKRKIKDFIHQGKIVGIVIVP